MSRHDPRPPRLEVRIDRGTVSTKNPRSIFAPPLWTQWTEWLGAAVRGADGPDWMWRHVRVVEAMFDKCYYRTSSPRGGIKVVGHIHRVKFVNPADQFDVPRCVCKPPDKRRARRGSYRGKGGQKLIWTWYLPQDWLERVWGDPETGGLFEKRIILERRGPLLTLARQVSRGIEFMSDSVVLRKGA